MHSSRGHGDVHETVGAYALGVLDNAEATAFEAHLATCEWCAQQLDELAGMEPMLAALADMPGSHGTPAIGESLAARPTLRFADRLAGEVAQHRARSKRSRRAFFGLAASLIIGGPVTAIAVTGDDTVQQAQPLQATSPTRDTFTDMTDKAEATDRRTEVSATVGMEKEEWGTHAVLELKNVKGPEKCSLIAVGKNGERETATTWAVPKWGYAIKNATAAQSKSPLYVHGGVAMNTADIDHFEVMTFDGKKLVEVDV